MFNQVDALLQGVDEDSMYCSFESSIHQTNNSWAVANVYVKTNLSRQLIKFDEMFSIPLVRHNARSHRRET